MALNEFAMNTTTYSGRRAGRGAGGQGGREGSRRQGGRGAGRQAGGQGSRGQGGRGAGRKV